MKLFGASASPYVRKTLAFAAEKGIELELVPAGGPEAREFGQASRLNLCRWQVEVAFFGSGARERRTVLFHLPPSTW